MAISAQRNSIDLIRRIDRNSTGLIRPRLATTTAARTGNLALRARAAVDRGLRSPAAGRHDLEQAAGQVGRAERHQLLIGLRPRIAGERKGSSGGGSLDKAHQGDPQGAGPEFFRKGKVGQGEGRQPGLYLADQLEPLAVQYPKSGQGDAGGNGHQRRRRFWCEMLQADHQQPHGQRQHQRGHGKLRQMVADGTDVAEKPGLGDVNPQQLGDLVEDDDQADPRLEASEHRFGDQVGHGAEAQDPRQQQERPDQQ